MNWKYAVIVLAAVELAYAQSGGAPATLAFDVASIKPSKSADPRSSNFPLGPGDVYVPNGGLFSATKQPLVSYIFFAYKIIGNQAQYLLSQLPGWAQTEGFDIQARSAGNPNKDEMRVMMQSLLAVRFKLATHNETRNVPVFAFVLSKPGKTGPQLRRHPNDSSCSTTAPSFSEPDANKAWSQTVGAGFPAFCNGVIGSPPGVPGRMRRGGRNLTLSFIGDSLGAIAELGRPLIDHTGLSGTFDFTIEWEPEIHGPVAESADARLEPSGPDFRQALREQLGLKLVAGKSPVEMLLVDHVERPTEN